VSNDLEKLAARAAPAIFVVLWSTGFVATKYVLHNAEPLTYLSIRMAVVVMLMAVIVAIARAATAGSYRHRPQRRRRHSGATGSIWAGPRSRLRIRFPLGFRP